MKYGGVGFVCANQPLLSYVFSGVWKSSGPFQTMPKEKRKKEKKRIVAHGQDPPFLKGNYIVAIVFTRTHPTHYYLESSGSTTDMKTHHDLTPGQCMVFLLGNWKHVTLLYTIMSMFFLFLFLKHMDFHCKPIQI